MSKDTFDAFYLVIHVEDVDAIQESQEGKDLCEALDWGYKYFNYDNFNVSYFFAKEMYTNIETILNELRSSSVVDVEYYFVAAINTNEIKMFGDLELDMDDFTSIEELFKSVSGDSKLSQKAKNCFKNILEKIKENFSSPSPKN